MRITEEQRASIVRAVKRRFGPSARVLLFGSRVDDAKRGGDIDLLVETEYSGEQALTAKFHALSDIQRDIGERKIDLVLAIGSSTSEIVRQARAQGIEL